MRFESKLWKVPGPGGWTFAPVPEDLAPEPAAPWGRTPVVATVDGQTWETSVWRDKAHGTLLPVPAKIRRGKTHGDIVQVEIKER